MTTMMIPLDRLVASAKKTKEPPVAPVKNDPPTIFLSMRPAVLLLANGTSVSADPDSGFRICCIANWFRSSEYGPRSLLRRKRPGFRSMRARHLDT